MFVEFTKKQVDGKPYKVCVNTDHIVLFRKSYKGTYIEVTRDAESLPYLMVEEDYDTVKSKVRQGVNNA